MYGSIGRQHRHRNGSDDGSRSLNMPRPGLRRYIMPAGLAGTPRRFFWATAVLAADPKAVAADILSNPQFQSTFPGDSVELGPRRWHPRSRHDRPVNRTALHRIPARPTPTATLAAAIRTGKRARGPGHAILFGGPGPQLSPARHRRCRLSRPGTLSAGTPAPRADDRSQPTRQGPPDCRPYRARRRPISTCRRRRHRSGRSTRRSASRRRASMARRSISSCCAFSANCATSRPHRRRFLYQPRDPAQRHPVRPHREALGTVVGAVELCHFGGRRGDATLFEHCVAAYRRAAEGRA